MGHIPLIGVRALMWISCTPSKICAVSSLTIPLVCGFPCLSTSVLWPIHVFVVPHPVYSTHGLYHMQSAAHMVCSSRGLLQWLSSPHPITTTRIIFKTCQSEQDATLPDILQCCLLRCCVLHLLPIGHPAHCPPADDQESIQPLHIC